jgi:uncharacterized protein (DUF305 family)
MPEHHHAGASRGPVNHYGRLAAMIALSFAAMFILMYAMVNTYDNVYANLNQFYMAGLMTAAMVVIELGLMGGMYPDKRINLAIASAGALALVLLWIATRQQAAISDKQFLRSMIPHHGGAILMCEQAPIHDVDIKRLCQEITSSQASEIGRMKAKLRELQ